jgi:hypothetical protein
MQRRDDFKLAGRLPGRHGPGTASPVANRGADVAEPLAFDQRCTNGHDAMIKLLTSNLMARPIDRAYIFCGVDRPRLPWMRVRQPQGRWRIPLR